MTKFSAKIAYVPRASAPDDYDPDVSRIPDDRFVVARKSDGSTASIYGDHSWDRSAYNHDSKTETLYFDCWGDDNGLTGTRLQLVSEMKWFMFVLIYLKPGPAFAFNTLVGHLHNLRALAKFCELKKLRIQDVLASADLSTAFLEAIATGKSTASLQDVLRKLGPQTVGFSVPTRAEIDSIRKIAYTFRKEYKQHPPIPTQIYSSILTSQATVLANLASRLDDVLNIAHECCVDPLLGRSRSGQKAQKRKTQSLTGSKTRPPFSALLENYGLEDFWMTGKYHESRRGLYSYLKDVLFVAGLQVLAYTGMRLNEVEALPFDCLSEVDRDGTVHYIVSGRVTKLSKGKAKRVQWVTNSTARNAILIAQRIAKFIYNAIGTPPNYDLRFTNNFFLFVTPLYLNEVRGGVNSPICMALASNVEIRDRIAPSIGPDDHRELRSIDPHRNWTVEERFRIGAAWPLSAHQYRRSLALYAQRSGLVSLPSLKRQLQHITLEMAQYYARGSGFAVDFIGSLQNDRHFGEEWQDTQPMSQYLSYAAHVLLGNDEDLFGGHAHWAKARLKTSDGSLLESREVTMARFRRGEMAYTSTPVGGCANPGPCNKNPIDVLHIDCVAENCKHLVGNFSKTELVIKVKTRELEGLRKSCVNLPEILHEEAELKKLITGFTKAKEGRERGRGSS